MSRPSRRSLLGGLAAGAALSRRADAGAQDERDWPPYREGRTRFAVNLDDWFTSLPFLDRIVRAAEFGFRAFEFEGWQGRDLGFAARVCAEMELAVAQFRAVSFDLGLNDPERHAQVESEVRHACELAGGLGAKRLMLIAGDERPGVELERQLADVAGILTRVAPIAADAGITLVVEPLNARLDYPGTLLRGSEAAVRLCRQVDSPVVKVCWNLYHMQIEEGDLCGHLEEGFDQLGTVRLADHPGRSEPGTGEIRFARVLRALDELGYDGWVGLACRPSGGDEEAAARRVVAADRAD